MTPLGTAALEHKERTMHRKTPATPSPLPAIVTGCAVGLIFLIQLDPIGQIAAATWQTDHPERLTYSITGRI